MALARAAAQHLLSERTSWIQRIRATLYHHGVAGAPDDLRTLAGRQFLAGLELPLDAAERLRVALEIIDMLEIQLSAIERDLRALARHQVGCRALMGQYGMGELSALVTLVELGDVTRMHASRQAVRMAGSTSAFTALTATPSWASSPAKAPRRCAGRCLRPPSPHAGPPAPTTPTTTRSRTAACRTPARR